MWILRRLLSQVFARQTPPLESSRAGADSASTIEQVRALVKARNLDDALATVEAVLEGEPENVDALVLSGEILRRRRRIEDAKAAYRRALVLDPERYEAWLDLGTCHYLQKDYFWARFYYRTANTLAPGSADVWNELGLIEILLGNYDKAAESLNTAVNIEPERAARSRRRAGTFCGPLSSGRTTTLRSSISESRCAIWSRSTRRRTRFAARSR